MSRTVRTTPRHLRVRDGASESTFLYDLRYANAELARAAREGRRPAPAKRLRRTTSWQWMVLYCRKGSFSGEVASAEGRARLVALMATLPVPGEEPQDFRFRLWQADDDPICCPPTCGTNCCAPSTAPPWLTNS